MSHRTSIDEHWNTVARRNVSERRECLRVRLGYTHYFREVLRDDGHTNQTTTRTAWRCHRMTSEIREKQTSKVFRRFSRWD